jgi:hypothetical protein
MMTALAAVVGSILRLGQGDVLSLMKKEPKNNSVEAPAFGNIQVSSCGVPSHACPESKRHIPGEISVCRRVM